MLHFDRRKAVLLFSNKTDYFRIKKVTFSSKLPMLPVSEKKITCFRVKNSSKQNYDSGVNER